MTQTAHKNAAADAGAGECRDRWPASAAVPRHGWLGSSGGCHCRDVEMADDDARAPVLDVYDSPIAPAGDGRAVETHFDGRVSPAVNQASLQLMLGRAERPVARLGSNAIPRLSEAPDRTPGSVGPCSETAQALVAVLMPVQEISNLVVLGL